MGGLGPPVLYAFPYSSYQLVLLLVIAVPLLVGLSAVLGFWNGQTLKIWDLGGKSVKNYFLQEFWKCRRDNHFRIIQSAALSLLYGDYKF